MRHRWLIGLAAATAALSLAAGCATDPTVARRGMVELADGPPGVTRSTRVRAGLRPLGSVPYDNLVLPIVSPDGRYLATETGAPPTWEAILAQPEAAVPEATTVEIYRIDRGEETSGRPGGPKLLTTLGEPVLLGRACDPAGFLVESVRPDGARWIGRAGWETGEITWLIQGPDVNAFASLGSGGRMAWSRRPAGGEHFDLVVRLGGQEWTIDSQGDDWLMPTWTRRGDGLFVLVLRNGFLDAVHVIASSPAAFRQSLRRLPLASNASVYSAYQTANGQVASIDGPQPTLDQLVFFHPARLRVAVWRPLSPGGTTPILLHEKSVTALVGDDDFALVATEDRLFRESLDDPADRVELLRGVLIPRAISSSDAPYLLLSAATEGRIGLLEMSLLE